MQGVTIRDMTHNTDGVPVLSVHLPDILRGLGPLADGLHWRIAPGIEANGAAADELDALADSQTTLSTDALIRLGDATLQIIDGTFTGSSPDGRVVLVIRAVDSSLYDVLSDESAVLACVRRCFPDVLPYSSEA